MFALEKDEEDDPSKEGLVVSSVWEGCLAGYVQ